MTRLIIVALVTLLSFSASAQKSVRINAGEVARCVGKPVTVTDSVYGYERTAKAMLIYLGSAKPKQLLTVVLKGDAIAEPEFFKQSMVTASGTVTKRLSGFELVVSDPDYFLVRRMAIVGMPMSLSIKLAGRMNPESPRLPLNELKNHIGENVYLSGTITSRRGVSDSLTYLYVGSTYPNHLLTVILKGKQLNKELTYLQINWDSRFSGELLMIEGKPTIIVSSSFQIAQQIML
jgi:hypothetical protein